MRIEIFKYKETSLVIDDIGKSINEDGILGECYKKAIQALERYAGQTKRCREQIKTAGDSASQINDVLYQSPHNIIAFSGKRGTGKTSAMISFSEFLKKRGETSAESRKLWENEKQLKDMQTLVLSPIDPTMLENDQDILSVVLSRLLYKAEERWNQNPGFHRKNQNLERDKNDLLKKATACMNGINAVKKNAEIKSLSDLQRVGDSAILKKNLFDFVDLVNVFCLGTGSGRPEFNYLVVPIDDTDCQIEKAFEVMEDIRRYLTLPNVIILMATDGDMLRTVFTQRYAEKFRTGIEKRFIGPTEMEHYAEKYLTKLIPGTHRAYLPVFENVLQGNSVRLELGYYENENRDVDLISRSTRLSRDQKRDNNDYRDLDYDFQAKILTFIYRKTGIVFSGHTAYINNIIPTTMRGLAHLLNFLDSMEDVKEFDYSHEYSAEELREVLGDRLSTLERNLDLFEEYFMNEWVSAKVSGDMARTLKGIEEQVPANIIQYAYDEMYDKYIYSKNNNNEPGRYPRKSEAAYYDLMEMMSGINHTINGTGIPKIFKQRSDFYNTFAVRTLLAIKNNKQAIRYRLQAMNSATEKDEDKGQWRMNYESCVISGSFPDSINVAEGEYKKYLMPIVSLYSDLLLDKVGVKGQLELFEEFCLQELAWTVLCNWEVQDIIFKSVEGYLKKRDERDIEELWEEIQKAIKNKNCNMLEKLIEKGTAKIKKNPKVYLKGISGLINDVDYEALEKKEEMSVSSQFETNLEAELNAEFEEESLIRKKVIEIERKLQGRSGVNQSMLIDDLREMNKLLESKKSDIEAFRKATGNDESSDQPQTEDWKTSINKLENIISEGKVIEASVTGELNLQEKEEGSDLSSNSISSETINKIHSWITEIQECETQMGYLTDNT